METVRFGDYVFPHNPKTIRVTVERMGALWELPRIGQQPVRTGPERRRVRLRGELFGSTPEEAMAKCLELESLCHIHRRALLFLPGMAPFAAVAEKLELIGSGDGRVLSYEMGFREEPVDGEAMGWNL